MRVEKYVAQLAAGKLWCSACKSFHPAKDFGLDANKPRGRARYCRKSRSKPKTWACIDCGRFGRKCGVHRRIAQMRQTAIARGQAAPSVSEMEKMFRDSAMICSECGRQMGLTGRHYGHGRTVSLQHWRNGTMSVICMSCNAKHAQAGTDEEFERRKAESIPSGQLRCSSCKTYHDASAFGRDVSRPTGRAAVCRASRVKGDGR